MSSGNPVAVTLSVTDEEEIERPILAHSPRLRRILELAEQQIREGEGIPHDAFWNEVEEQEVG